MGGDMDLLKEQLQEDIISYLDGLPQEMVEGLCEVVIQTVDRVKDLEKSGVNSGFDINPISREEYNRIVIINSTQDRRIEEIWR
jgi:hypothetical protein